MHYRRFLFYHKFVYYIVVNIPFFVIRLVVWHNYDKHVSVFFVKNVLGIGFAFQHLHEVLKEASDGIEPDTHSAAAGSSAEVALDDL